MNNAELFKKVFGIYAEEFWAYPTDEMLNWLTYDVPERKVGEWVEPTRDGCITYDKHAYAECSACGEKAYLGWWMHYCPNCGARMFDKDNNVPNKGESDG